MASSKDFRSAAGKRHNIGLTECKDLNELDYAWKANYNQRALLLRILCHSKDKKCSMSQSSTIESVKFFSKEKEQSEASYLMYDCYNSFHQLSLDNFYKYIDSFLKSFENSEISEDYWKEIVNCLELFDYKYEKIEGVEFWSSEKSPKTDEDLVEAFGKMSLEQTAYVSAFVQALRTDMKNGHAKMWIDELIKILLKCVGADGSADVSGFAPVQYDNTNTVMEIVFGDLDNSITQMEYNAEPYFSSSFSNSSSLVSSLSSLNLESTRLTEAADLAPEVHPVHLSQPHKKVVPDFCVALPAFPGMFPLVFELKPAYQESHGLVQNIQQMLSKLFFQDIVFGIVVSPRSFQLSVIIKKDKDLHFASTPSMTFRGIQNPPKLDLKELNTMCTFIFRVLKWARKSKCMIKTKDSCELEKKSEKSL
ncbi:unnamed protein product [Mytilus coruscus]|uniref:Uncharacterized protein n=1 Tax=Mytilus coruscus TaxID=42192 RepID=A0A6J8BYL7_MYTCO|nr:unnamed protein product [Mytilus coruscus]